MSARRPGVVLAVDLGTGGPKVGLVTVEGATLAAEHLAVATRLLPRGGAVQDAGEWWGLVAGAARRLLASGVADPAHLVAVSCTGQWASTVPVGEDGRPVGDCLLWLDTRGGAATRRAVGGRVAGYRPRALAHWIRRSGGAPSTSGADPIGHIGFLEQELPEVARRARWYLEPVDYLSMCFSAVAAASPASMAGAWLTATGDPDPRTYDPLLVRLAGVPADKLPPLVPTCSVTGAVTAAASVATGVPEGVPVVAGTPDLHSAAAGAGAVGDHETHLTLSTTSWISCPVRSKKTDPFRQVATVPGLTADTYLVADNHDTGARALEWARDLLFGSDDPAGDGAAGGGDRRPGFDELEAMAARVPAGSGGVLFTPWLAGERSPVDDRSARGGFHNLDLATSRAQLVRAVFEGVAHNSRWLHDAVEHLCRRRLDPLRIIGGGAQSALWCAIHADVLERTVEQVAAPVFANLRGAALLAGLALGHVDRHEVRTLVPVAARFEPSGQAARYRAAAAEFPRLYRAQKPLFATNRPDGGGGP